MELSYADLVELGMDGANLAVSASDFRYDHLLEVAMRKKKSSTLTIKNAHHYDQAQRREIARRSQGPVEFCFFHA